MLTAYLSAALVEVLAQQGPPSSGHTPTSLLLHPMFSILHTALRVVAIAMVFVLIFKVAKLLMGTGWIVSGLNGVYIPLWTVGTAFIVWVAWSPENLVSLLAPLGGMFSNLFDLVGSA